MSTSVWTSGWLVRWRAGELTELASSVREQTKLVRAHWCETGETWQIWMFAKI